MTLNDNVLSTWVDGSLQELVMRLDGHNSDVATGMNYNVVSFSSLSLFICNRRTCIMKIRGPLMCITSFRR